MKIPFAFRLILAPLALTYGLITAMRNFLFDIRMLRPHSFPIPIINVGNLSTGGTGKSPMVMKIAGLLIDKKRVAVLSRGYGRKTKGFLEVSDTSAAGEVGDEALQLKLRFPDIDVLVCENRVAGIQRIMADKKVDVVILDDAFQHRWVKARLNILLTPAHHPYSTDFLLPLGNLRERRAGSRRADVVVVSKVEAQHSTDPKDWKLILRTQDRQALVLSRIQYGSPVFPFLQERKEMPKEVVLITGIAESRSYVEYLEDRCTVIAHHDYTDHHIFTTAMVEKWMEKHPEAFFWTTEKDWMRLRNIWPKERQQIGYTPIETDIFAGTSNFEELIERYVG